MCTVCTYEIVCYNCSMRNSLEIHNLTKQYDGGHKALSDVNLNVQVGEIFCLLGANGAGKTTLINSVCGIVQPTSGTILVSGHDAWSEYRSARAKLSLVPQEIMLDPFVTVLNTLQLARGYFGKTQDRELEEQILKSVGLWDKRDSKTGELSGGMKRRVLIAKALMNEPELLFLDEPTAGVDVELRREMWETVNELKKNGTSIFLTTHYLEEAERYADRVGYISNGILHFVKDKKELMDEYPGLSLEDIYVELTKKY